MNDLDNSVIILTSKTQKNETPALSEIPKRRSKRILLRNSLKSVTSSTTRLEQLRLKKKLIRNAKHTSEDQTMENESIQDNTIVLRDNESQSSWKETGNKAKRKAKKRPLELAVDNNNQSTECLHNPCKRRKKNETDPLTIRRNGNKKNSEITTIVLDDEKIDSINQGTDEIVVVWSNTKTSPKLDNELRDGSVILEEDEVYFMVDRTPDPKNLRCLRQKLIDVEPEIQEEQENSKRGFPSFSNSGLKLPKAQNISGHIKMKTPERHNRLQSKRKMPSFPQVFSTFPPYSTPAMFSRVPACAGIQFGTFDTSFDVNCNNNVICEGSSATNCGVGASSELAPKFGTAPPTASPPRFDNNPLPPCTVASTEQSRQCMEEQFPASTSSTSYTCGSGAVHRPALRTFKSGTLREIIIDGNNVAMRYTGGREFSEKGLKLVIDFFQKRGHPVKVFLPQSRFSPLLEQWYSKGIVVYTPSRRIGNTNRRITPYDDRYILEYATMCGGIVISSDQYRDLYEEKPEWRETIEKRLMAPTFVGDYVMFPWDPLGRRGPNLETFLRH